MTAPELTATKGDFVFAAFADPCAQGTMTAGSGWTVTDVLSTYYFLLESRTDGITPVQPTATNPLSSNCWLGVSVALHRR